MFTGLIRELAYVKSFKNNILSLKAKYKPKIGDSIAINGACLTVTKILDDGFEVELSPETQKLIALENYKDFVHIEPAMQMGDRFEGHIVQGHIDTTGIISNITKNNNSFEFEIKVDKDFMKFIIKKGSIAVDGVSLTINEVYNNSFRLTIIPHTFNNTLFKTYKLNQRVNIEFDFFAKYIYNMFKKEDNLSWDTIDKIQSLY